MKKLIALILTTAILNAVIAVIPAADGAKPIMATSVMIPIGKTGNKISLAELSKLKPTDYEKLANVKLNFFDRMKYNRAMKKLRNSIAEDGTVKDKKLTENLRSIAGDFTEDFSLGGAALGLGLGPLGVIIAYLVNDSMKTERVKWAWIGFAGWLIIVLILVALV